MALDPSIALQVRPVQIPNQLQDYANMIALQGGMNQNRLADIQFRQAQQAEQDQNVLREVLSSPEVAGDPAKARNALLSRGLYKPALEMGKADLEQKKTQAQISKDQADAMKTRIGVYRDVLAGINDPASYGIWRQTLVQEIPQFAGSIPEQFSPEGKRGLLMKAEDLVKQLTPEYKQVDLGGRVEMVDVNPFTNPAIRGTKLDKTMTPGEKDASARGWANINLEKEKFNYAKTEPKLKYDSERGIMVDERTGRAATVIGADGKPLQSTPKLTEAQGNASGFGMRAISSNAILHELESSGTFGRAGNVVGGTRESLERVPVVGTALGNVAGAAGNMALTGAQQRYGQAKGDFLRAVLRKESGATITKEETDSGDRQYFPVAGDSQSVIEQKRQNRITAIESLKVQAGPGAIYIQLPKPRQPVDPSRAPIPQRGWSIEPVN